MALFTFKSLLYGSKPACTIQRDLKMKQINSDIFNFVIYTCALLLCHVKMSSVTKAYLCA